MITVILLGPFLLLTGIFQELCKRNKGEVYKKRKKLIEYSGSNKLLMIITIMD